MHLFRSVRLMGVEVQDRDRHRLARAAGINKRVWSTDLNEHVVFRHWPGRNDDAGIGPEQARRPGAGPRHHPLRGASCPWRRHDTRRSIGTCHHCRG